jgi:hypothetical protein
MCNYGTVRQLREWREETPLRILAVTLSRQSGTHGMNACSLVCSISCKRSSSAIVSNFLTRFFLNVYQQACHMLPTAPLTALKAVGSSFYPFIHDYPFTESHAFAHVLCSCWLNLHILIHTGMMGYQTLPHAPFHSQPPQFMNQGAQAIPTCGVTLCKCKY